MVRVLFQQLATPANLPVGLDEVLDWTDDVLARVDRKLFFQRFEAAEAVQYFYEPFLQAYDPELRRELGVWYTPPEVVDYMVERVDRGAARRARPPARPRRPERPRARPVHRHRLLPDRRPRHGSSPPCSEQGGDGLVAAEAKQAALSRIHGFELLPAPFVIAHLRIGIALQRLGVPLNAKTGNAPAST